MWSGVGWGGRGGVGCQTDLHTGNMMLNVIGHTCCWLWVYVWDLTTRELTIMIVDDATADFGFMFETVWDKNLRWWCLMMMMMMMLQTLGSCLRPQWTWTWDDDDVADFGFMSESSHDHHTETWDDNAWWWWWWRCCRLWFHVWELTTQKPGMIMLYDDDGVADFGFMFESSPHRNLGW